jgi:hypothetical protein
MFDDLAAIGVITRHVALRDELRDVQIKKEMGEGFAASVLDLVDKVDKIIGVADAALVDPRGSGAVV